MGSQSKTATLQKGKQPELQNGRTAAEWVAARTATLLWSKRPYVIYVLMERSLPKWVKVQLRGPELYKKKGALFQEESYLPRIFRSSSLNLHTFHLINIVFWWRIFVCKHGKLTPNDRQDHHVLVADVMTSQCSQSHVAKQWQPRAGNAVDRFWTGCHVDAMAAVWQNHIGKTLKLHSNWGHPSTIV